MSKVITIICKGDQEVPQLDVELLQQSSFLEASLSCDQDVRTIHLPMLEKEYLLHAYEFWKLHQQQPYVIVKPAHYDVKTLKNMIPSNYLQWVSQFPLKKLNEMLCSANYLGDERMTNLCIINCSIQLRQITSIEKLKQELEITCIPSPDELKAIKTKYYDPTTKKRNHGDQQQETIPNQKKTPNTKKRKRKDPKATIPKKKKKKNSLPLRMNEKLPLRMNEKLHK